MPIFWTSGLKQFQVALLFSSYIITLKTRVTCFESSDVPMGWSEACRIRAPVRGRKRQGWGGVTHALQSLLFLSFIYRLSR